MLLNKCYVHVCDAPTNVFVTHSHPWLAVLVFLSLQVLTCPCAYIRMIISWHVCTLACVQPHTIAHILKHILHAHIFIVRTNSIHILKDIHVHVPCMFVRFHKNVQIYCTLLMHRHIFIIWTNQRHILEHITYPCALPVCLCVLQHVCINIYIYIYIYIYICVSHNQRKHICLYFI